MFLEIISKKSKLFWKKERKALSKCCLTNENAFFFCYHAVVGGTKYVQ